MANPFVKGWKYMMALFGAKIDQYADPKVQIQQAIEEAQHNHQSLVQQAAAVIGNEKQLSMQLARALDNVEKLQSQARQALVLADKKTAEGKADEAARFTDTAQTFATQLVAAEEDVERLKGLYQQASSASEQARKAVENNAMTLQQKLAEKSQLMSQLEQAKMQEQVAGALEGMSALQAPGNTPQLDEIRDRIERRYADAMGRSELASNTVEGRMLEVQKSTLDVAGASRLEQIRASMGGDQLGAKPAQPAVTSEPATDGASVTRLDEIRASLKKDPAKGQTS